MNANAIHHAHSPDLKNTRSVSYPMNNLEVMRRASTVFASCAAHNLFKAGGYAGSHPMIEYLIKRSAKFVCKLFLLWMMLFGITACGEKMAPASIMGYNHTANQPIYHFSVNGQGGHNMSPRGGGGSESCCVSLPVQWRPGLKATIAWTYDSFQTDPKPPPPDQEIEVEIPEYKNHGSFQVHFYNNHKVKIAVSRCNIGHPFHPMSPEDKLPWVDEFSREDAIESHNKGGTIIDC